MIIKKVEMTNYKTVKDYVEYNYDQGLNLILGKNGGGKSSSIDAIRLLTVGFTGAKNLKELANWDNPKEGFQIACEFDVDGTAYRSEMTLTISGRSNVTNRKLFIDGELELEGSEPVIERLSEIFEPKLVDNALFLRQKVNNIVDVTDSERRETIKKMKDIDYASQVTKEIEPEISQLKESITEVEKEIFALENKTYDPDIVKELPMSQIKYNELLEEKTSLSKELTLIQDKLKEKNEKEAELNNLEDLLRDNADAVTKNKVDIKLQEEYLDNIETERSNERVSSTKKVEELEGELTRLDSQHELDKEDLTITYKETCSDINFDITELEKSLELYPVKRIAKYDSDPLDEYKRTKAVKESVIMDLTKSLKDMEEGLCPTCGKPYEASEIKEYEDELEKAKAELFECEEAIAKLEADKVTHDKKVETNNANKLKKSEITSNIEAKKTKLESLKTQLEKDIQNNLDQITEKITTTAESLKLYIDKLENIDVVYDSKKETIKARIVSLNEANQRLEKDNKNHEKVLDKLKSEIDSFEVGSISDKESQLHTLSSRIKEYDDMVVKNDAIRESNKKLEQQEKDDKVELETVLTKRDKLKSSLLANETAKSVLLKDLPNYIISQNIGELEDDINSLVDQVYDRSLNLKFKQNKSSIELKYGNASNLKNCKGGLSGAEGSIVNLGFINSFNQALDLGCLFLDEADASLNEENSESMFSAIGEMSEKYQQLFVVTHNEKMKSYMVNHFDANVVEI